MPINLTDYNKMIVGSKVTHQGIYQEVLPEGEPTRLHKKLIEEQQQIAAAQQTSVGTSLKTSAYQQDMVTNK